MTHKILYIEQPLSPPGGGQFSLLLILQSLNREKFSPFVFMNRESEFGDRVSQMQIPCQVIPPNKLYRAFKRVDPQIIHCNAATTRYAFWSALFAKLRGIPFLWHVRVVESAGWRDRVICGLSKKIIVISNAVRAKFEGICDPAKIHRIYNAIATSVFRPGLDVEYLYDSLSIKKQTKIVGVFSRLDPWKGHEVFFESAKMIQEKIPQTAFLIAGEGEDNYKNQLRDFVRSQGLKNVIFAGFRDDIPQLMNICDIIVSPSVEPEPFGRVVIEAMSCARPVVAFRTGGHVETIVDHETGILLPPKDPHALAQACVFLLENRERAYEMGLKGRRRAEDFFSAKANISQIEQIYEGIIPKLKQYP